MRAPSHEDESDDHVFFLSATLALTWPHRPRALALAELLLREVSLGASVLP